MVRATIKMYCEIVIVSCGVGKNTQRKVTTIEIRNNITNSLASNSLHCLSSLKLLNIRQSNTTINGNINNKGLIRINVAVVKHNW